MAQVTWSRGKRALVVILVLLGLFRALLHFFPKELPGGAWGAAAVTLLFIGLLVALLIVGAITQDLQ